MMVDWGWDYGPAPTDTATPLGPPNPTRLIYDGGDDHDQSTTHLEDEGPSVPRTSRDYLGTSRGHEPR